MDQEDLLKHPHNKMEAPGRCCDAVDGKSEKVKATDNGYVVLIKEGSAHRGARWLNCDREFCQKAASKKVTQWGERDPNLSSKFFASSAPLAGA